MEKIKTLVSVLAGLGAVFIIVLAAAFWPVLETRVAVIPVRGAISPGALEASPSNVQEQIQTARSEGAEGFLFQIKSPGGTVVASRQLEKTIDNVEEPTVCQLQDYATSGAYWAASACDKIVTDPLTMTGGIGVMASYLEYSEFMEDEGIQYIRLIEGDLKDMGSPYRNITDEERKLFEKILKETHADFTDTILQNRKIDEDMMEEIKRGHIFMGSEALELGLADQLGGKQEAKKIFEEVFNETVVLEEYRRNPGLIELLFGTRSETSGKLEEMSSSAEVNPPKLYALVG